jgi:glucan phosphoethanolaminetransferase (alkaline phosphatase superfamily)
MAEWMGLPAKENFSYRREIFPEREALESKPNIVLVMCESFSMYKSNMSGNPLNTTPYFNQMADSGIFFEKCFSPHFSTARGLFALLTGIPDVQLSKFSTRNERHWISIRSSIILKGMIRCISWVVALNSIIFMAC